MLGKETGKKLIVPAVLVLLIAIAAGTSTLLLIAWMLLLPLMVTDGLEWMLRRKVSTCRQPLLFVKA